ncbi:MAG TPA: hypothetical protein VGY48_02595 [Vicinamibacterales bacterium]|jgi:hypothetical protein|nr:hypothetical protein [Vicinamibacterales bacterium]
MFVGRADNLDEGFSLARLIVGLEAGALKPWANPRGNIEPQPGPGGEQCVDFKRGQFPPLFTQLRERSSRVARELPP